MCIRDRKKQFKRNKKEYLKLAEHIGLLPLVVISPADEQLINEGSDLRRKYIDGVMSQYDKDYLNDVIRYNRLLQQRNSLLKQLRETNQPFTHLDVWDEQLATLGTSIYNKRTTFIKELAPVYHHYQTYLAGGHEKVELKYCSHLDEAPLLDQLIQNRSKDVIVGYTTKGIHKDDLELLLSGYPIKKTGSQGQKKTFLIALKLAQYDFLVKHSQLRPILLLDDIFDKLDEARSAKLVQLVAEDHFQQIFITDTRQEQLNHLLTQVAKPSKIFQVQDGEFTQLPPTSYAKK
jgi:DNA replication and repair protein RecF